MRASVTWHKRIEINIMTTPFNAGKCPAGYQEIGDSCYNLVSETKTYTFAEGAELCRKSGGHLVAIQSKAENDVLSNAFKQKVQDVYLAGWCIMYVLKLFVSLFPYMLVYRIFRRVFVIPNRHAYGLPFGYS